MTISGPAGSRIAVDAARIAAVAVTYAVAAKLGLLLATIGVTVTLVWPASGVAVAALVLLGDRMVIGVVLGAFLAHATTSAPLPAARAAGAGPPPAGAVAALVVLGARMVVGGALAAFLANATASAPLPVAIAAAAGNSLEALVASQLLRRVADFNPRLQRVRDVFALTVLGAEIGRAS